MLVEINLLPKKESGNKALFILLGILLFIFLVGIGMTIWIGQLYKGQAERVNQQLVTTEQLILAIQEKSNLSEATNSLVELEKAIKWADEYPIKTVPVLRKFTALLPERGFVQSFIYNEAGTIQLTVQFDTSREASYYLKSMLDSDWVKDVQLHSVVANELEKEESDEDRQVELKNSHFIPRYLAEFEVTLNKSLIKEAIQAEAQGGEDS